jgi:quercetin dioxygenase-like cupin family protein
MFQKKSDSGYITPLGGIRQKTTVWGEKSLMTEFLLDKGAKLPRHAHPYEQTGYLVKGHIRLRVEDEEFDATPGDSWSIIANAMHGAEILEDSVAIEVFSPVRKDYLPHNQK